MIDHHNSVIVEMFLQSIVHEQHSTITMLCHLTPYSCKHDSAELQDALWFLIVGRKGFALLSLCSNILSCSSPAISAYFMLGLWSSSPCLAFIVFATTAIWSQVRAFGSTSCHSVLLVVITHSIAHALHTCFESEHNAELCGACQVLDSCRDVFMASPTSISFICLCLSCPVSRIWFLGCGLSVTVEWALQTVARDLATAQGRLTTASSELKQIAAQAERDSQELRQARVLIAQLQAQRCSADEHDSEELSMAQRDMHKAQADLDQARHELSMLQTQLAASQQTAQQDKVEFPSNQRS